MFSSLDGVDGWRVPRGEKKRGGCGRSRRLYDPPISPHLVSALRLHVWYWCCCARQPQGFLFRKEPKTRAIPLRLGQTLLGFRAVRSPLLQEKLSVSQSVSQSFYFDFLPHKSFAYSISLFTRLDINIASVATATTNIKEEETERNWFKRLKKCVLWCRCVCDIAKLSHFEIILISHKLLCENNFGFFPGGHCHYLFVFCLYSFAWKSRFTPNFSFSRPCCRCPSRHCNNHPAQYFFSTPPFLFSPLCACVCPPLSTYPLLPTYSPLAPRDSCTHWGSCLNMLLL